MRPHRISAAPVLITAVLLGSVAWADALWQDNPQLKVRNQVPLKVSAFDLREVRLLEGPFQHAQELDRQYLLRLDVDRLLHNFRVNAGLPSTAQPLGGWEEPKCELRGHFVGHYLSACALMYASTGDAHLREKGDAVVAGLAACQDKLGSGYLSAYPEEFLDRVERQQRVWAPYYTLHKLFAGLLDMYVYGENAQALDVCRRFADWVIARNGKLSDDQMQKMLGNEHGGMNETLANLYGLTGEAKYLQIAQRFNHHAVLDPASRREDKLTGLHANTQIPKFVGTAREYELTGTESLKTASTFFWDAVVYERSYVIGGHSDGEMFSPKETLSRALGPSTTETCNTYNMLKLTRHVFAWDPRAAYADYYERALYNHILASQNPADGMTCYYVPLRSGSHKEYCDENNSFWCCTGTGVENHAKYGDSIYFHAGTAGLYVNLFIASELNWKARGLTLRQETRYPDAQQTRLRFTVQKPTRLEVHLRRPAWATDAYAVNVNGKPQTVSAAPGTWVTVSRTWATGDEVEVRMPFVLRTEGFRDNPGRLAFLYGPLVLSAEMDGRTALRAIVGDRRALTPRLTALPGKPNTFAGPAEMFRVAGESAATPVTFEPFYQMHGRRAYQVYWDVFTPDEWQVKETEFKAERARQQELEARTIDSVHPGEEQNERDHQLHGENMSAGDFGDRHWRHATDGGWFSWELKVHPDRPQELQVTYWGSDAGNRIFDLQVDGTLLKTQRLENNQPLKFYEEHYALPAELVRGKGKITLRFQAHPGAWAGGVYGVRVLDAKP